MTQMPDYYVHVFPVPTGMNRLPGVMSQHFMGVPRAHGDEPVCCAPGVKVHQCSPCPRG